MSEHRISFQEKLNYHLFQRKGSWVAGSGEHSTRRVRLSSLISNYSAEIQEHRGRNVLTQLVSAEGRLSFWNLLKWVIKPVAKMPFGTGLGGSLNLFWFLRNTVTFESVLRQERSRLNLYFPPKSWVVVGTKRLIRATYSPGLGLKFEALLSCKIGFSGMLLWGEGLLGWSGPQGRDDRLLSPETWENERQVASRDHRLPGAKLPFLLGGSAKGHHHVSKEGKGRTYWGRILNPTTLAVSRIWTLCVGRRERPNVPGLLLSKGKGEGRGPGAPYPKVTTPSA